MCRETRSEELVDDGGDHGDHDEVGKQLHGVDDQAGKGHALFDIAAGDADDAEDEADDGHEQCENGQHDAAGAQCLELTEVTESMMLEMMAITAIVATSETMLMTNEATPTPLLPFSGETGWT